MMCHVGLKGLNLLWSTFKEVVFIAQLLVIQLNSFFPHAMSQIKFFPTITLISFKKTHERHESTDNKV